MRDKNAMMFDVYSNHIASLFDWSIDLWQVYFTIVFLIEDSNNKQDRDIT